MIWRARASVDRVRPSLDDVATKPAVVVRTEALTGVVATAVARPARPALRVAWSKVTTGATVVP